MLCLCGNPTDSVIIYASLWPGGGNLLKGWIFVFIPDVMRSKFGSRVRCVSAEIFLISLMIAHITAPGVKERLHAAQNMPKICAICDAFVFYDLACASQTACMHTVRMREHVWPLSLSPPRSVSQTHIQCGLMGCFSWKLGLQFID